MPMMSATAVLDGPRDTPSDRPMALPPAAIQRANDSDTIMTGGEPAVSEPSKPRPLMIGSPIVEKKLGSTASDDELAGISRSTPSIVILNPAALAKVPGILREADSMAPFRRNRASSSSRNAAPRSDV